MAVTVVLSLVGPTEPRAVQVAVTGLSGGEVVSVAGSAAGHSWSVRGGRSVVVSGSVLRLVDVATPINAEVTYTVTVDEDVYAETITVPSSARTVLQSLDGRIVVPVSWLDNADPRSRTHRGALHAIPGRSTPVALWDVTTATTRRLRMRLSPSASSALEQYLSTVADVVLLRTTPPLRDFRPVEYLRITASSDRLFGSEGDRVWDLSCVVIDDPEPDTIVPISTWDDFDAAFADLTWDDFDAEMASMTWDDFDALDWTQYA